MVIQLGDFLQSLLGELDFEMSGRLDLRTPLTGIEADSRRIEGGEIFFAIQGGSRDGHAFIPQAVAQGAAVVVGMEVRPDVPVPYLRVADSRRALAVLAAAWHGFPARRLQVIGVTGTDGKTTTVNLIYQILIAAGYSTGLISTVNAMIGGQTLDTGFHVTTPEAPDVQRYLHQMVSAGTTHAVLEATSHGLAQERVTGCEFDIAVVTNITHEHLDYHGSQAAYRQAKARLFTGLLETRPKESGNPRLAILNHDDASYDFLESEIRATNQRSGVAPEQQIRILTYGRHTQADVMATAVETSDRGMRFAILDLQGSTTFIQTNLVGDFNVSNILAAYTAVVHGLGVDPRFAAQGVQALEGIPGRMERLDMGTPFRTIVDFAHTPNALRRSLEAARQILAEQPGPGRVIAIFGSAGLRDREKRRLMAAEGVQLADISIFTAEDPRTESLSAILAEMAAGAEAVGGVRNETYLVVPDRGEAIRRGLALARAGDIVLALGKGHEQSMCFGEVEYPWDDRLAMRAALAEYLGIPGPAMPYLPTQDRSQPPD